jgi:hypothetical protein
LHSARRFYLSTHGLDLRGRARRHLIYPHRQTFGERTIAQDLDKGICLLDDTLGCQGLTVYNIAVLESRLQTPNIDRGILDTVDVVKARELGETAREWSLSTLEPVTLRTTGAGLLSIIPSGGRFAMSRSVTAPNSLAILG